VKKKPNTEPTEQDLKDWDNFISNVKSVEDKDAKFDNSLIEDNSNQLFDIRKDLHGLKMHEALNVVSHTIKQAIESGKRKILFITGKGLHSNNDQDPYLSKDLSLLRYAVPEHIQNNYLENLVKIEKSPEKFGGSGSIIVFLKK